MAINDGPRDVAVADDLEVTAYLFDRKRGTPVDSWIESFHALSENQVLWLDLVDPSADEAREVAEILAIDRVAIPEAGDRETRAALEQREGYLRVTAVAVSDSENDPSRERVAVECYVGKNWVLSVHSAEIAVLEDFREIVAGDGAIGGLDAPAFLAVLLEWVVSSYLRAFDEIEETLEEFDVTALAAPSRDPENRITMLIEARRRVGKLRRALAPHREVFAALSHSEFDPISSEGSAERFLELTSRIDSALAAARDAKDGIASSFDVLIVRTEHRTNEIVKVLTLASILLLPGALVAGVAGMNVNFKPDVFIHSSLFWGVLAAIVLVALGTLALARQRSWI